MRNTCFILLTAIILLASCHATDKDQYPSVNNDLSNIGFLALKAKFNGLEPLMGLKSSSTPRGRTGAAMSEKEMREFSDQLSNRRRKLALEARIPIPTKGQPLPISLRQAHEEYVSFVSKNKNDEIYLSLFIQVFASLILKDYGLLDTDDYKLIHYYLTELISASSNDFATMTLSIAKLQESHYYKIEEIDPLINKIVEMAEKRYKIEQVALPHILKMNEKLNQKKENKTADSNDRLMLIGADNIVNKLKNSDAKTCIELFRGSK